MIKSYVELIRDYQLRDSSSALTNSAIVKAGQ